MSPFGLPADLFRQSEILEHPQCTIQEEWNPIY